MKLGRRFSGSESGVAAVEMGLVAPILLIALLGMLDVGEAVAERMGLDRAVRAGAQAVMANINEPDAVKDVVVASLSGAQGVSVTVDKTCKCGSTSTDCNLLCGQEPPSVFVNISAVQPYSPRILPTSVLSPLKSKTHVQLR